MEFSKLLRNCGKLIWHWHTTASFLFRTRTNLFSFHSQRSYITVIAIYLEVPKQSRFPHSIPWVFAITTGVTFADIRLSFDFRNLIQSDTFQWKIRMHRYIVYQIYQKIKTIENWLIDAHDTDDTISVKFTFWVSTAETLIFNANQTSIISFHVVVFSSSVIKMNHEFCTQSCKMKCIIQDRKQIFYVE